MREIKFRAWDNKNKKMDLNLVLGIKEIIDHNMQILDKEFLILEKKARMYKIIEGFSKQDYFLMQFTGLKDKNGKEIYEGDIVNWKQSEGGLLSADTKIYKCEIKYDSNDACFVCVEGIHRFSLIPEHIEVIGNIYENPELLK